MTASSWRQPARSSQDWGRPTSPRETIVEDQLRIGAVDCDETDAALRVLRWLTGRCDTEIHAGVAELLELAEAAADAENGPRDAFHCSVDEYADALYRFARVPDDTFDLAAGLYPGEQSSRALTVVPS